MTLAEKLFAARVKKKMSMKDVEHLSRKISKDHRSGTTQGYISRLESGKEINPSYLKIKTLSSIYGIKPGSLF